MEENRKIRRVSTIRVSTKMNVHASFSFLLYIIISYLIISSKEKIEKSFCNPSIQQLLNFHLKLFIFFFPFYRTNDYSRFLLLSFIVTFPQLFDYDSRTRIRGIWPRLGREIETHVRSITKHFHRSRFARFSARGSGRPRNLGCEFARFSCLSAMT